MGKLVTTTELVEVLGASRTTLAKAIESGRLTVKKRDGRGRPQFDLEQAVREWSERRAGRGQQDGQAEEKNRGGRPPKSAQIAAIEPQPVPTYSISTLEGPEFAALIEKLATLTPAQQLVQVDVIKKLRDARRVELQVLKEEGQLIDIEKSRADGAALASVLLGSLSAMPSRLFQQLAVMNNPNDPREVHELLTNEVNHMVAVVRKQCGLDDEGGDAVGAEAAG